MLVCGWVGGCLGSRVCVLVGGWVSRSMGGCVGGRVSVEVGGWVGV